MEWISAIGTVAFAFSGYLVGVKKRLDLLGILIVALLTGIGGGIMRDVLVHRVPLVFYDYTNVVIIAITLLLSWLTGLHKRESQTFYRAFIVADSLGLVAFSITGAQVGLMYDLNAFGVVLLGFITAVGGGVVRDMMVNDIPFILHEDFYGTVSILVAGGLFVLDQLVYVNYLSLQLLFGIGLAIRLIGHWRDMTLPKIGMGGDKE
ncbi:MAG: trimeric intracellular cation channel family protein [Paludibacterium sp.]|uniref:trimeric intracellular cation channel family protein n=1 Tax=Paludibacterium sp. TaxID=1917523 RepID=UPI0025D18289|nr:trimeric intracellular cation channel family protein [Paludibacterium sp.]MBV8049492.1 trimeric intracellular cation channel family protein [Paludibacterium sp.]MBV8646247.1 trimeric intracellular cation channel family protein [Paludibacterium sp.]